MDTLKHFMVGLFAIIVSLVIAALIFMTWPLIIGLGSIILSIIVVALYIILIFYIIVLVGYLVNKLIKLIKRR